MLNRNILITAAISVFFLTALGGPALAQTQGSIEAGKALMDEAVTDTRSPNPETRRRANAKLTEARRLFAEAGDLKLQLQAMQLLARNLSLLNDAAGAISAHREIVDLAGKLNDKESVATALVNVAFLETGNGSLERAREAAEEARKIGIELGSKQLVARSEEAFANIFQRYGNFSAALESIEKAIVIYREAGNRMQEALGLRTAANIRGRFGETKEATDAIVRALELVGENGDPRLRSQLFLLLGQLRMDVNDLSGAETSFNNVLRLSESSGDTFTTARGLMAMGRTCIAKGDFSGALVNLQKAKVIFDDGSNTSQKSLALSYMGTAYSGLGRHEEALPLLYESLFLTRVGEALTDSADQHVLISKELKALGKTRLAIAHAKAAVNLLQSVRSRIASEDEATRKSFIASTDSAYRHLSSLLIGENRLEEALLVINLFKDQQYLDYSGDETSLPGVPLSRIESDFISSLDKRALEYRGNEQRIAGLRRRGSSTSQSEAPAQLSEIRVKRDSIVSDAVTLLESQEWNRQTPSSDAVVETQYATSLQNTLASASKGGVVVAVVTLVGAEDFHVLVVTRGSIRSVTTKNASDRVNKLAVRLWSLLQTDDYDPTATSKELYDLVFKPIEKEIPTGTTTLLWGLDGNMRYVPVSALYDGRRYLIERYRLAQFTRNDRISGDAPRTSTAGIGFGVTSSSVVQIGSQKFAFNALPGVELELSQIFGEPTRSKGALDGTVLRDGDFTKERFFYELSKKRPVVHIASHFAFRPGDMSRSFLLMGDGSPLTLADFKSKPALFDGVNLLTLSACSTAARQKGANGNEIDALAETAHRLGARSIVASLWEISDASTPFLMRALYSSLGQRGASKADALRNGQLSLLNGKEQSGTRASTSAPKKDTKRADLVTSEPIDAPPYKPKAGARFAHPHYWASFILIGDWR